MSISFEPRVGADAINPGEGTAPGPRSDAASGILQRLKRIVSAIMGLTITVAFLGYIALKVLFAPSTPQPGGLSTGGDTTTPIVRPPVRSSGN